MEKVKCEKKLIQEYLVTMGRNIKEQREIVFREDYVNFSKRVSDVLGMMISPDVVKMIEDGSGSVPMNIYLGIFIIMKVDTPLMSSTKNNTMLYLASIETPSSIEVEMKNFLKDETIKKDHG